MRALEQEVQAAEDRLETRKVIDRAKGILMDRHGMKEQDAFSWLQRRAMSERVKLKDVGERVIAGDLAPDPS